MSGDWSEQEFVDLAPLGWRYHEATSALRSARGDWACWLRRKGDPNPVLVAVEWQTVRTLDGRAKPAWTVGDVLTAQILSIFRHIEDERAAHHRRRLFFRLQPERQRTARDRARRAWRSRASR